VIPWESSLHEVSSLAACVMPGWPPSRFLDLGLLAGRGLEGFIDSRSIYRVDSDMSSEGSSCPRPISLICNEFSRFPVFRTRTCAESSIHMLALLFFCVPCILSQAANKGPLGFWEEGGVKVRSCIKCAPFGCCTPESKLNCKVQGLPDGFQVAPRALRRDSCCF
jgi:hypothetical protein